MVHYQQISTLQGIGLQQRESFFIQHKVPHPSIVKLGNEARSVVPCRLQGKKQRLLRTGGHRPTVCKQPFDALRGVSQTLSTNDLRYFSNFVRHSFLSSLKSSCGYFSVSWSIFFINCFKKSL